MSPEDQRILAMTIFSEAWGEDIEGQKAVAWVIKNRANQGTKYGGPTIKGVCLARGQFDCWNDGEAGINAQINANQQSRAAYQAIAAWVPTVYYGKDNTINSDHYNNPSIQGYLDGPPFNYRLRRTVTIGDHQFYQSY